VIATKRYVRESGNHSRRTIQLQMISVTLCFSRRLNWLLNGRMNLSGGLRANLRKLADSDTLCCTCPRLQLAACRAPNMCLVYRQSLRGVLLRRHQDLRKFEALSSLVPEIRGSDPVSNCHAYDKFIAVDNRRRCRCRLGSRSLGYL
jgi:hypothetical protein